MTNEQENLDYVPICPGCSGPMWQQKRAARGGGVEHYYGCPAGCVWRLCLLDPTGSAEVAPHPSLRQIIATLHAWLSENEGRSLALQRDGTRFAAEALQRDEGGDARGPEAQGATIAEALAQLVPLLWEEEPNG